MLAGGLDERVQSFDFRFQHDESGSCQPVGFAWFAAGLRLVAGDALDQPLILQSSEGPVKRAVAQLDLAVAERFDLLQDGVAVFLLSRNTQQDEKRGLSKREKVFRHRVTP